MARGMAQVTLHGNLGRDPELRYIDSGAAVVSFSLAVNTRAKQDGEWQDIVNWYDVTFWGKPAEIIDQWLTKGSSLLVIGDQHYEDWQTTDGETRRSIRVTGRDFVFTGPRQDAEPERKESLDDVPF